MIVSEEEARKSICPEFSDSAHTRLCHGSKCMMWWFIGWRNENFDGWFQTKENAENAAIGEVVHVGYCGKAKR